MPFPLLALAGINAGVAGLGGWWNSRQQKKANEAAQAAERRRIALIQAAIAKRKVNAARYAQDQKGGDTYRQGLQSLYAGATQVGNTYNRQAAESGANNGVRGAGAGLTSAAYNFARPGLDVANEQMAEQKATSEMNAELAGYGQVPLSYPQQTSFNPFSAIAGPLAQYTMGQIPQARTGSNAPVDMTVAGGQTSSIFSGQQTQPSLVAAGAPQNMLMTPAQEQMNRWSPGGGQMLPGFNPGVRGAQWRMDPRLAAFQQMMGLR
jgi:hypothetical protein